MKLNKTILAAVTTMLLALPSKAENLPAATLRRPISAEQPMWLMHIDTWNVVDPQRIIDMVPDDIKPYVVFNISLSINHKEDKFLQVEYGYETAKSWLRTCAENQVWAMVQPSSGAFSHIPDGDMTIPEEFFRDYPNFLGFNYCEQFWGFGDPWGVTYEQRLDQFAKLMALSVKYGGYLCWSWCNAYYDADHNAIAMMKLNKELRDLCHDHPENFIVCEKYTMNHGFHDIESTCMGAWISGYAGHYGTRFDECGWRGASPREKFPVSAGPAPVLEHLLLTGETVMDGPETIMAQVCHEIEETTTADGYTARQWEFYPQFVNIYWDIFRKIIDGTVKILTREEVIDRTKVMLINDVNIVSDDRDELRANYITPETLYDGLYKMPGDGTYLRQYSWFKSTGRYAAIPMIYGFADDAAKSIPVQVNVSDYSKRWPDEAAKVNEFNRMYPQEYTGDMYAGRQDNRWVTYNPFKDGRSAHASIPFTYNTCDRMELSFSQYSTMIVKEYRDKLELYLNNYDNAKPEPRTDTVSIVGVKGKPSFIAKDRVIKRIDTDTVSSVRAEGGKGVYTLYITHNGPLDITVNCKGKAKGRIKTIPADRKLVPPSKAPAYNGPYQYEAENFEYKNIERVVKNGVNLAVRNYTAQGYMRFGSDPKAEVRDIIVSRNGGNGTITLKYSAPEGARQLKLMIGSSSYDLKLAATASESEWAETSVNVNLAKGDNVIRMSAAGGTGTLLLDNIVLK